MREIKFRILNKNGSWIYGVYPYKSGPANYTMFQFWQLVENSCSYQIETLSMYTGLHDKNGKEIYEGDIVRYSYYVDYGQDGELKSCLLPAVVRWDSERAGFSPLLSWREYNDQLKTCEVIGNKWQNPELLENK